ncbi:50S ribosomal protein L29 [Candidatus Aerophobetes bacterium]|nr:50S ribosomal protein L29 [Candidatus Aerophobetes bacterium]
MKIAELRDMDKEDLFSSLARLRKELFNLKIEITQGRTKTSSKVKQIKRNIAQIMTLLRERGISL